MSKIGNMGFYGILTDPVVGYVALASTMVEKGVKIIQLRMKSVAADIVLETARAVRAKIPSSVAFIVNDDPHIALAADADGVHLGQDDMSFREARAILGPDAIIGLSTHNPQQTQAACALNPDYIGVGPVYATPTKNIPDPVLGISGMQEMLRIATVPAVCLGGIDHGNVDDVIAGGAQNICAVRCVNASKTPDVELEKLLSKMLKFNK